MKKLKQWFDGLMIAYEGFLIMVSIALVVVSFIGMINTKGWEFVACFAGFVFFLGSSYI